MALSPMPRALAVPPRRLETRIAALTLLILALAAGAARAADPEVRGTWLTTTGPDHVRSGYNTESIVNQLEGARLNTLYVEAWKNGYTNYDSSILDDLIGVDRNTFLGNRDLLDETTAAAHRRGMNHVAWFEYGFASQFLGATEGGYENPLTTHARSRGWLLEDQAGSVVNASNPFAWMNPAVPEVRRLMIDLTLEAIKTHDLDGVQFDDRLAWPNAFGFDDTTAALYRAETGRSLPTGPNAPDDAHFKAWRQSKVTLFARELDAAIDRYRPDLRVSVSPSVEGFSQANFNADWEAWSQLGLFDEFVPQVYRSSLADFQRDLPDNVEVLRDAGRLGNGVIGLRFNGGGGATSLSDLLAMIDEVRAVEGGDLAGHAMFYSEGVIDHAAALAAYYGSDADSPFYDPGHRPDPLVASNTAASTWSVTVDAAEQYRVIAEVAGLWREIDSGLFEAGSHEFDLPGATVVELVLDRRPIEGDTDFDRDVDLDDLQALADAMDQPGGLMDGDFNWDGVVDDADLDLIEATFGWNAPAAPSFEEALTLTGIAIPEPASALLLAGLGGVLARRRRGGTRPLRRT